VALTEQVVLDIQSAERQITVLEGQLAQLGTPINVPVSVTGENDLDQVRQNLSQSEDAVAELNRELNQTDDALANVGRDARDASDSIERAGRQGATGFANLRAALGGVAAGLIAIQGARIAFDFAGDAIQSASELEQSIGAVDAVFGDLGTSVRAFGETADQSVGLAASQFNQLASLLGSQLQTFGFSAQAAADETQKLIVLASDLAATFGGPVSQAVEAISSLLRGEVNPIERYGVAMNETLVAAKALELGLAGTTAELDLQDKTLARLAILMEQTANAQGQFGREAETTAGRLERIRAQFENTRAEIGDALVPAFETLLDITPALIQVFEDGLAPALISLGTAFEDAGDDAAGFADFLAGLPVAAETLFGTVGDAGGFLVNIFQGLGDVLSLDVAGGFDEVTQAADNLQGIGDRFTINTAIQSLLDTIAAGRPPIQAFADTLASIADSGLDADQFGALAGRMAQIAQLNFDNLGDLRRFFQDADRAELAALGFDEDEIEAIIEVLSGLRREILGVGDDMVAGERKGRFFRDNLDEITAAAQTNAAALDNLVFDFDFGNLPTELQSVITSLGEVGVVAQGVDLGTIIEEFSNTEGSASDAAAAVDDYRLAVLALVDPAIALLRAQDDVTAAQEAYNEVLADPDATKDDLVRVTGDLAVAQAELLTANQGLPEDLGLTTTALGEMALQAGADQSAVDLLIDSLTTLNGTTASAQIVLDIITGALPDLSQGIVAPGIRVPAGIFANEGPTVGGINVTQNFTSPETPSTDRSRAVQSINGIIAAGVN
jgi:hypothetical protein